MYDKGVKETLCTNCVKRMVCKYTIVFIETVKETDAIEKQDIHSIEVKCSEFMQIKPVMR